MGGEHMRDQPKEKNNREEEQQVTIVEREITLALINEKINILLQQTNELLEEIKGSKKN
jgi:hypothetical protein